MSQILLAFSTVDGHTLKICQRIRGVLEAGGHRVTLLEITDAEFPDCSTFDKIVLGASVRYGRHRKSVYDFIDHHLALLQSAPSAFFSVNVVARKVGKDTADGNPYIKAFRRLSGWSPRVIAVFAGKIDYPRYSRIDRMVIRFIMWMTRGPTDPRASVEFTNWVAVDAFAGEVSRM